MNFETDRLILRPWFESDAEALYRYARDPQVGPIAGWPPHTSVENSREIIRTVLSKPETYAIVLKPSNEPIGSIGLMRNGDGIYPIGETEVELGFWVGVPHWGHGYAPEASHCLIRYAFEQLNITAVWCGYYDGNLKSKRAQEKIGFKYHHTIENVNVPLMNDVRTAHVNLMTREQWTVANRQHVSAV